ncbi:MAG: hypothetical protein E7612_03050 [Ruminococcaceae bacterium]|nr:hypothetical protein [Oscillospiraceae bacterium]
MQNNPQKKEGTYADLTGIRRAIPIILVAIAVFISLCFFMQDTGAFGRAISSVLLGLFSIGGYFIPAFLILHAIFYASDYFKKRTVSRIIFTVITVITLSALIHAITYYGEDITFSASQLYQNGIDSVGGGFVGGAVAFALTKIFGTVGLIIIAIALFSLYLTYYLSGAKSLLLKALLKLLNGISGCFSSFSESRKNTKAEREKAREEHVREMLAAQQDSLIDDEFFAADSGLKELKINELGIEESISDEQAEKNPHLHNKVYTNREASSKPRHYSAYDSVFSDAMASDTDKRRVNMDYSTTNSAHTLSDSTADSIYEPRHDDIIYEEPTVHDYDANADELFSKNFETLDFKLNEELSNKPSSKASKDIKRPEPVNEITVPITEITAEDVEKARQRADFEMKKKMAIEAQKRYAEAQANLNREKEAAQTSSTQHSAVENQSVNYSAAYSANEAQPQNNYTPYQANEAQPQNSYTPYQANEAQPQNSYTPYQANEAQPQNSYTPYQANEAQPYIPEYMKEESAQEAPAVDNANESFAFENSRKEIFESAISDYEKEREATEFKPYNPPVLNDFTEQNEITTNEQELRISRTMLDPTPSPKDESAYGETDESNFELDESTGLEFDSFAEEGDDDENEGETVFDFSQSNAEDDITEDANEEEIPPEEQSATVIEQRKLFPFLDGEETDSNESDGDAVITESFDSFNADGNENSEDDPEGDGTDAPPFEYSAPKSTFAERFMTPSAPIKHPVPEQNTVVEKPDYSDYQYPSVELLAKGKFEEDLNQEEEKNQNAEKLVDALLQFNVRISIKGIDRGPRITRYEIVPARGVKVNSVTNLFNDIALNLGVEGMRMEAPIPGKSAIGVEIPNKKPSTVLLRDLVESDEFICSSSKTMSCLGKDVTGNPVFADIAKMPHVLVAGATGMGKSVCINSILISILYKARPDEVKFIMIDPKKVEFNGYNGIPHLLIPVVTDVKQAAGALMWAVEQMEKRYDLMEALEVRKLDSYNEKVRENPELGEPLPKIIIVIDELNDIMLQVRKPAEDLIMSIAQKARAAGIHLVIGTQRPSVDVITGVIKANIPSRISCKVASYNDSKTILEQAGAEKLLNNGDMLYIPAGAPKALRVQGAFVSDGEVTAIMKFLKSQAKGSVYDAQALEEINRAAQKCSKGKGGDDFDDDDGDDRESLGVLSDQQFLDAVDLAIKSGKISTSLIQRKIGVGYGKAAKFIDYMEDMGIVSEPNGQKPRDILITKDEWHEMLSRRSLD